jgi:Eukaryotic aspartyl protease
MLIAGIGFQQNEAILGNGGSAYPNVVEVMVKEKFIASRVYSLYLDDIQTSTGSIIFGGIDSEKFCGTLATIPMNTYLNTSIAIAMEITLTDLALTSPDGGDTTYVSSPINVLLDSGSTFMHLPSDLVDSIAQTLGATYDPDAGQYGWEDCNERFDHGVLTFSFSGVEISVSSDEFVVPAVADNGTVLPMCVLGLVSETNPLDYSLGDTFLRSAYVVYDLVSPLCI